ncbi:MAG: outer membrane protein assembly factor BamE [Rickettsiales bacterium]|nr:MAG: outer membrane protein assembly factor BamE [Rickettsiales bacterium]
MIHLKTLITIIFLMLLTGCQSIDVRGQNVSDEAVEEINSKKPHKEQLVDLIGTPTYVPDYSKDTWYYIQRTVARKAWLTPKVAEQRIVKINFVNNRVIDAIVIKDMQNEEIVAKSSYTQTYGTKQNGVQKFVKNIGRFNKTKKNNKKKKK